MLSEVLSSIDGIRIFPIAGLVIFVLTFAAITVWVVRLDKKTISEAERLPLEGSSTPQEDSYHG